MTFEEMQTRWSEIDRKLDTAILLNKQQHALQVAQSRLRWQRIGIAGNTSVNFIILIALGYFISRNIGAPLLLMSALALHFAVIGLVASGVRQLIALSEVDWSVSVTDVQRQLELIRALRGRTNKLTLAIAPLLWIPMLAVALKAAFGIDAYQVFPDVWLIANFLFGVAFLILTLWLSRRFGDRLPDGSWIKRLADDFSGRTLARTSKFLQDVAAFRRET